MALVLNGVDQWIHATWGRNQIPVTLSIWIRRGAIGENTFLGYGNHTAELNFNDAQCKYSDNTRVISFDPDGNYIAEADGTAITDITTYHHVIAKFVSGQMYVRVDGGTATTVSWTSGGSTYPDIYIGRNASDTYPSPWNGAIAHVALWGADLTPTEELELYNLTTNPANIQSSSLLYYNTFEDTLTPVVDTLSFSTFGLSSPSYETSGIVYPGGGTSYSVTYNGNGSLTGSVPTDSNEYAENDTVAVLGNTGSLAKPAYTFGGWNTSADGSGTTYAGGNTFSMGTENVVLYAVWVLGSRVINHENFDSCDSMSNATITAAATLKVIFEHASTGQDIVGNSDTDCSDGLNYDESEDCGLKELHAVNSRYNCSRLSLTDAEMLDETWFTTSNGLMSWRRNNPPPATKLSMYLGASATIMGQVNVYMYKYCWIDVWPETTGYVSDGAAYAASEISQRETFEASYPGVVMPYWTMPLESTESFAERDAYNNAIRTYCVANNKWLIDMADIENYTFSDTKVTSVGGYDTADASYTLVDGGHLASTGRIRMARAYWTLLGSIVGEATYHVSDVTRDNDGNILGGCTVFLLRYAEGTLSVIGSTTSNATTGAFSIEAPDNVANYGLLSFINGGTPRADATYPNIQPEAQ